MRSVFPLLKIAVFAAVVAAPLAALAIGGPVLPYGQKPLPEFPTLRAVVQGKSGALDKFGEAVLDRSAMTEAAIRIRNFAAYTANLTDTDRIIFGRDGWLFYKEELSCLDRKQLSTALDQVDAMIETAKAGGIELIVSVSPDKGSIYPEKMHPLARPYWACKLQDNHIWRDSLAQHPNILDHAVPILAEKEREPRAKLFFETDTHWTTLGASWALRQLIGAASHQKDIRLPNPRLTGETSARPTDMANQMLLLPGQESYDKIDMTTEAGLAQLAGVPKRKTVIIHDSFYHMLGESFVSNFPGAADFHLESDVDKYPTAIAGAERVIVNSVERAFVSRVLNGSMGSNSPLVRAIQDRRNSRKQD
jgi:hypothetical protein